MFIIIIFDSNNATDHIPHLGIGSVDIFGVIQAGVAVEIFFILTKGGLVGAVDRLLAAQPGARCVTATVATQSIGIADCRPTVEDAAQAAKELLAVLPSYDKLVGRGFALASVFVEACTSIVDGFVNPTGRNIPTLQRRKLLAINCG